MNFRSLVPAKSPPSTKIQATMEKIGRDLERLATKLKTEEDVIATESLAMVEGDNAATKRLDEARDRRDRLISDREALSAALNRARTQLEQAKAEEDIAGRKEKEKQHEALLARRLQRAKQVEEAMIRLRDECRELMADTAQINAITRELMNQTTIRRLLDWRETLEQPKTEQRLAEAAHSNGLAEVFPVQNIPSWGADKRPFDELEAAACTRARWQIAYTEELAGGPRAKRLPLRRADGTM